MDFHIDRFKRKPVPHVLSKHITTPVIDDIARIDLFIQDKVRHGDGSEGTAHLGHRDTYK
jgi:hypothetical protein